MSTELIFKFCVVIGPIVDPPNISERFTKYCTGTSTFLHRFAKIVDEYASEV